jgi:hypothetical protein
VIPTSIRALLVPFVLAAAGFFEPASAEFAHLDAKVVWVRDGRVYLALPDSAVLEPGQLVSFVLRKRQIAAGEILRVFDREMAVATLRSGSLERVKKLDRVRVLAERGRPAALPMLRVGYPSQKRVNLLFECGEPAMRPPLPDSIYRTEVLNERSARLVREREFVGVPWPDTLLVRDFDEAADEEIALERGELDAAVFWPGEMSSHLREQPRWRDPLTATMGHGVVLATWDAEAAALDSSGSFPFAADSLFALLNREIFGGDLAPWSEVAMRGGRPLTPSGSAPIDLVRFEVDRSLPGHQLIERFLNRGRKPQGARERVALVRLVYLDLPLSSSWQPGTAPLFAIRCPVVAAPERRRSLAALGADSLLGMLDCRVARRGP